MRAIIICCFLWLSACATPPGAGPAADAPAEVKVSLKQAGDHEWIARYEFVEPVSWVAFIVPFDRYRLNHWTRADTGETIPKAYGLDYLKFAEPRTSFDIMISETDAFDNLSGQPIQEFSNGNLLLLTKQFFVTPVKSQSHLERMAEGRGYFSGPVWAHDIILSRDQSGVFEGEAVAGGASLRFDYSNQYLFLGKAPDKTYEHFDGIIDPGLATWIEMRLDDDFQSLLQTYQKQFGRQNAPRPYIFVLAQDQNRGGFGYSGSAFKDETLVLQLRGRRQLQPDEKIRNDILFFLGHEIGHMFQHQGRERGTVHGASWVVEGNANWMTRQVLMANGTHSEAAIKAQLIESYQDCLNGLEGTFSFGDSTRRNRYYGCGEIMAVIADALLPDKTIFDIWNRATDGSKSRAFNTGIFWTALRDLGVSGDYIGRMEILANERIERGQALGRDRDYAGLLNQLMRDAGLSPKWSDDGILTDLTLP